MKNYINIILGAGPAGLQLAYFFQKRSEPYLILERNAGAGSFFASYPRHRQLISINKVHIGYQDRESRWRYDWNSLLCDEEELLFKNYSREYFPSADVLVRYLQDFTNYYNLNIRYNTKVLQVIRTEECFQITTEQGEDFFADRLFVGTGFSLTHLPNIEGVELCEKYTSVSINPEDFTDQRVLIVGKGNSACEIADKLIPTTRKIQMCGINPVKLAWTTHHVGHVRALHNNFLETYQLKGQNNILEGELVKVTRSVSGELLAEIYFASRQRSYEFPCDRIILCTGFRFDTSIFGDNCQPELAWKNKLPKMTSEWESTNIKNLFFIGTLMQMRDYKKTSSGFIHGFRHNIEALDQILECKFQRKPWRKRLQLPHKGNKIASLAIERLSTSSAMLLQNGFLCDCIGVSHEEEINYFYDIPVDYIQEHLTPHFHTLYTITLEYKHCETYIDPFALPRGLNVNEDYYLHPIIRKFQAGMEVDRIFLPDDLDNDWRNEPKYLHYFEQYFTHEIETQGKQLATFEQLA
jgi:thioredoxin reductase